MTVAVRQELPKPSLWGGFAAFGGGQRWRYALRRRGGAATGREMQSLRFDVQLGSAIMANRMQFPPLNISPE